jgi:hypothetical protein
MQVVIQIIHYKELGVYWTLERPFLHWSPC